MKLNVKAMTLTVAIISGLGLFLLTWWIIIFEGANNNPVFLSKIYRGYTITPLGSIIGLLWAFFDGAVAGACFSWIYNNLITNNKN